MAHLGAMAHLDTALEHHPTHTSFYLNRRCDLYTRRASLKVDLQMHVGVEWGYEQEASSVLFVRGGRNLSSCDGDDA